MVEILVEQHDHVQHIKETYWVGSRNPTLTGMAPDNLEKNSDVIHDHNHLQFKEKEKIRVLRKEKLRFRDKNRIEILHYITRIQRLIGWYNTYWWNNTYNITICTNRKPHLTHYAPYMNFDDEIMAKFHMMSWGKANCKGGNWVIG